jgi:putative ABC transport system permease protein
VIAALVRQRHREIGIRIALGALTSHVRRLVLRDVLRLCTAGAATGLAGSVVASRFLRNLLFELDPLDLPTLVGAALALMAASLLAGYAPIRRAGRLDAATVLRAE